MTCHQCGWNSNSVLDDKVSKCSGCGEWFCEWCLDEDSHDCEGPEVDGDRTGFVVGGES